MSLEGKNIIFKCIVGSQAYGTNVEGSDIDIKGVYMQNPVEIMVSGYEDQIEVSKDEVYYELKRFIQLLKTANPTVLEMLYSPEECILHESPVFSLLKDKRDQFLTTACRNSFGGYAIQQIKKARGLEKKMNWKDEEMTRKTPLDFCYIYDKNIEGVRPLKKFFETYGLRQEYAGLAAIDHIRDGYALFYDASGADGYEPIGLKGIVLEDSNSIRLSSIPKDLPSIGVIHYNKDGYTQHCNKYKEYQTWLKERNVQRYVDIESHGQKIDGKNMLHCRRLIDTALEIATEGTLNVRRPNAQELIDIRKGKVDLETLLERAEADVARLDEVFDNSNLPDSVPSSVTQDLLFDMRYYEE